MKFYLYSINYSPELTGVGKYNGEFVSALVERGVDVSVVTAAPYYPEWCCHKGYSNEWSTTVSDGVSVLRNPLYIPSKLTTLKRLVHLVSFASSSFVTLIRLVRSKPDVLLLVQPTLFCAPGALLFCKLSGAKAVMHVQDFEVDAMFGLGMGKFDLFAAIASKIEYFLLSRFDSVSTISLSMMEKLRSKGVAESKIAFFPNWADVRTITPCVDGAAQREAWGFSDNEKIVLYAGNIGEKQGLELLLEAATRYQSTPSVRFVIVGAGAYVDTLKEIAEGLGLDNVLFKPLQPWSDVPAMLSMADVHVVIQRKGVADAVLPSKLTNILSVGGRAVVTAEEETELGRLARTYPGIFTCVEPESINDFCEGLDKELAKPRGANMVAREYAEQHLDKEVIIDRFVDDLNGLAACE